LGIIFFDLKEWYFQYQQTNLDTVSYWQFSVYVTLTTL
jgi:hypothetical protein